MSATSKTLFTFLLTAIAGAVTVLFSGPKKALKIKRSNKPVILDKDDLFI